MPSFTVKVTETYWRYDIEANSREDAISKTEVPLDQYDCDDYELSIEAEETDDY